MSNDVYAGEKNFAEALSKHTWLNDSFHLEEEDLGMVWTFKIYNLNI